jgi:hypothetical protein
VRRKNVRERKNNEKNSEKGEKEKNDERERIAVRKNSGE